MGRRGPKPTPSAVLSLSGSTLPAVRARDGEPKAPTVDDPTQLEPVADMLDARGLAVFRELAELVCMVPGLATRADALSLTLLADALVIYTAATRLIQTDGAVDGEGKPHPALRAWIAAGEKVRKGMDSFGLSPSARASFKSLGDMPTSADELSQMVLGG